MLPIDTILLRKSPAAYADGVYTLSGQDRPNPFDISERAHRSNTPNSLGSVRGRTAMQVYFGKCLSNCITRCKINFRIIWYTCISHCMHLLGISTALWLPKSLFGVVDVAMIFWTHALAADGLTTKKGLCRWFYHASFF